MKRPNGPNIINKFSDSTPINTFDAYRQALLEANVVEMHKLKREAYKYVQGYIRPFPYTGFMKLRAHTPELVAQIKNKCCRAWFGIRPIINKILCSHREVFIERWHEITNEMYIKLVANGCGWFFNKATRILWNYPGAHNKQRRATMYYKDMAKLIWGRNFAVRAMDADHPIPEERVMIDELQDSMDDNYYCPGAPPDLFDKLSTNPARIIEKRLFREQAFKGLMDDMFNESRIDKEALKKCLRYYFSKLFNGVQTASANVTKYPFELQYTRYLLNKYIRKHHLSVDDFIDEDVDFVPTMPKIIADYLGFKYEEFSDVKVNDNILSAKELLSDAYRESQNLC